MNHNEDMDLRFRIAEMFIKSIDDFPALDPNQQIVAIDIYYKYITKGEIPDDQERESGDDNTPKARRTSRTRRKPEETGIIDLQDE